MSVHYSPFLKLKTKLINIRMEDLFYREEWSSSCFKKIINKQKIQLIK